MSAFGEYLYQLIQSRELSVSRLSRDSGVERTAIHRALSGGRVLPYPAVRQLGDYLKLSPQESRRLYQYYERLFEGENTSRARELIEKMFQKLAALPQSGESSLDWFGKADLPDAFQEKNTYKGYGEISGILRFMIGEELRRENPLLELAAPAGVQILRECIERLYTEKAGIRISQILRFDTYGTGKEYNLHNLECLHHALPSAILSGGTYRIHYYYNEGTQTSYTDPLPYFLVTHEGALCFSENCQTGIYLPGQEQAAYFRACFYGLLRSCHSLLEYGEKEDMGEILSEGAWKWGDCGILTAPFWMKGERMSVIFTRAWVSEFMETGKGILTGKIPSTDRGILPLPGIALAEEKEERRKLLQGFLERIRGEEMKGRMMNDTLFLVPKDSSFFFSTDSFWLLYGEGQRQSIKLREPNLCKALYDWGIHALNSDFVFDKERTVEILEEIITK